MTNEGNPAQALAERIVAGGEATPEEMRRLVELDSQFLIATHSPILMAYPGARLYQLGETGVHAVDYRETEHYQLTKRFLEDPERMLHYLLMG